ncbi:hypothetical protein Acr_15g0019510 [Actinidia rufa]|uniref:Uncharacterized protein n=1 Tax=Actinidia rufa TaxID=165716 RepID=A0A7J0FXC9_9ERIC|nr:hypothetical protein Acr_15g0019510 [Actinidia rufa]
MRERNRNWARNWNHMGWGNFFETAGAVLHTTQQAWLGCTVQRGRATWSGAGAAAGGGLRGCWTDWAAWCCCLDYTRHKAAQGCAWLHGAGAGLLLVAVEAWAAGVRGRKSRIDTHGGSTATLQLGAYLHAPTAMSAWGLSEGTLTCKSPFVPDIPWDYCRLLPLVQASSAVIIPSSLNSSTSKGLRACTVAAAVGDLHPSKFKVYSKQCKEAIQAANNRQQSKDVTTLLAYEPIYQHTILCRAIELVRVSLPLLHIKGWALRHKDFRPERSGDELSMRQPTA